MTRQSECRPLFRMVRGSKHRGASVALHAHDEAQLLFAASGTMQVYTESGRWLVPPQLAVWLPVGVQHRTDVLSDTELWMIYWQAPAAQKWAPPALQARSFALQVTPLLRELIFAAFPANPAPDKTELVVRLILQELTETPNAPTFLPLPQGTVGRRVAELALADARCELDIGALASRAATSVRTISRLFPVETGLTFKAWRQRARIVVAIDQLATGSTIARVASQVGFASTAAFCFAFRQVTNTTPATFLCRGGRPRP